MISIKFMTWRFNQKITTVATEGNLIGETTSVGLFIIREKSIYYFIRSFSDFIKVFDKFVRLMIRD